MTTDGTRIDNNVNPRSVFNVGTTEVIYTIRMDTPVNKELLALCTFNVTVEEQGINYIK